jgi:hypothetical protein
MQQAARSSEHSGNLEVLGQALRTAQEEGIEPECEEGLEQGSDNVQGGRMSAAAVAVAETEHKLVGMAHKPAEAKK